MVISREAIVSSIMEAKQTRVVKVEDVTKVIEAFKKKFDKKNIHVQIMCGDSDTFKIIDGYYILNDNLDSIAQLKESLYFYSDFETFKVLDMIYDQSFILKVLDNKRKKRVGSNEYIKMLIEYGNFLKKLEQENPELAKEYAIECLKGSGILDEEGNLKAPYNGNKVNDTDFTRGPKPKVRQKQNKDQ